jgi:hypothetical protein
VASAIAAAGRRTSLSGISCAQLGDQKAKAAEHSRSAAAGFKNRLLMNVPRPDFHNLASTRRECETKRLFHKRNKEVVAARTQKGGEGVGQSLLHLLASDVGAISGVLSEPLLDTMSSAIKNSIRPPGMNDRVCPSCQAGDEVTALIGRMTTRSP